MSAELSPPTKLTRTLTLEGATVRRPGRAVLVAVSVMLLPFAGFVFVAAGASQGVRSLVAIIAVAEAFALLAAAMIFPRVIWGAGKPEATRVDVDPRGLVLDGRVAMARSDISSVSLAAAGDGGAHVVVGGARRLSTIVLDLRDADAARDLAIALDADVALTSYLVETDPLLPQRRVRRVLSRAAFAVPAFALISFVMATRMRAVVPVGYVPLALAFFLVLFRRAAPTRAFFGADGIALRRPRAAVRFVPFASIRALEATDRGADLELDTGERISLRLAGVDPATDAQATALARALEIAHRDLVRGERDDVVERRLERSQRSTRDWLGELRALRRNAVQGYRDLSLGEDRLLALVESPAATSSARAAAAVLVAPLLNQDGRVRVQAAASRTATPGLRAVLEATLREADEVELEALLDAQLVSPGRAR